MTRGICTIDNGKLMAINETKNIIRSHKGAESGRTELNVNSLVSMNFWCFPQSFIEVLKERFHRFLEELNDPMKDEYLLPIIADQMLKEGVEYSVLSTTSQWFGVTYNEDKPIVIKNIRQLINTGVYNEDLYSDL